MHNAQSTTSSNLATARSSEAVRKAMDVIWFKASFLILLVGEKLTEGRGEEPRVVSTATSSRFDDRKTSSRVGFIPILQSKIEAIEGPLLFACSRHGLRKSFRVPPKLLDNITYSSRFDRGLDRWRLVPA